MADIFVAQARRPHGRRRYLVIKRLRRELADDPCFVELFLHEAKVTALLNHPNIVPIYDFGRVDRHYFIAMPWVRGPTLAEIIATGATDRLFPSGLAWEVAIQALEALDYAHSLKDAKGRALGLVHRDISPGNLMIDAEGKVRLLDFGIASTRGRPHPSLGRGKLAYMSPEQCREEPVDKRSDLFAVGIVLWELLAGQSLFHRESAAATMVAVNEAPIPLLHELRPDIPKNLSGFIDHLLKRPLQHRPQDANLIGCLLRMAQPPARGQAWGEQLRSYIKAHSRNHPPQASRVRRPPQ